MPALDRRLARRARPVRALLALDVAIGLATAVLVLVGATLLARAVVRGVDGRAVTGLAVGLALVFAARGVLAWAFEVAGRRAAGKTLSELRLAVVAKRLREQPAALDRAEAGELTAAAVQGVDALEAYFARYLPQLVLGCIVPLAVLCWIVTVDLESAAVMALTLPLVPVFMWLIGRSTQARARERWRALRLLSGHFLDVVRGLPTLRAFNRGEAQAATIADVSEQYRRATMGTLRVAFLSGSVLELAATLGVALVAVTVGVRLAEGGIAFEAALTVLVLAPELYLPLRRLGAQFHASADGVAVAGRLLDLLDAPPAVSSGRLVAPSLAPIRFEGVSFAYPARPGLVLDGVDLELTPGETVALVGPSGAGKSTMAALLLLLAEPTAGRIAVSGADLRECNAAAWRAQLAWVSQRPAILRGTVAENIRLGSAHADDPAVAEAAALAGADRFVRALPQGYETLVGDGGRPLSAGERRRIALARAFLRDAPLVVLDEPTADLDPDAAAVVAEAVARLASGRTTLLITHRPELVAAADRVVALQHGRLVELRVGEPS